MRKQWAKEKNLISQKQKAGLVWFTWWINAQLDQVLFRGVCVVPIYAKILMTKYLENIFQWRNKYLKLIAYLLIACFAIKTIFFFSAHQEKNENILILRQVKIKQQFTIETKMLFTTIQKCQKLGSTKQN